MNELVMGGERTPQEWADYCREAERDTVIATIDWCRRITAAKENLNISFRDWAENYYITYKYSWLHKLAKIGADADRLCSITTHKQVENDATALYLLTTLTDDEIDEMDGKISQTSIKAFKHPPKVKRTPEPFKYQPDIRCCDLADLEISGADAIITDPPYPKEYLPVFSTLSKQASEWLKPGGSLVVMCGQYYLPQVLAGLGEYLQYHWCAAHLTPGGQAVQIFPRKVNTFWKPLLWFTNGDYAGDWVGDVTKSDTNDNDKHHHEWGQSESGMVDIVERFSEPDDLIVDPFLGGGTTALVAAELGRRFVGCDNDQKAIETTRERLGNVTR